MIQAKRDVLPMAIAGATVGSCMAAAWTEAFGTLRPGLAPVPDLLAQHHTLASAVAVFFLVTVAAISARNVFRSNEAAILAVSALGAGVFVPAVLSAALRAITGTPSAAPVAWMAVAGLPVLAKALLERNRRLVSAAAALIVGPICIAHPVTLSCPPSLARAAVTYAPLPDLASLAPGVLQFSTAGCLAAVALAVLLNTSLLRTIVIGSTVGTALGLLTSLSHVVAMLTMMQTGWSWIAVTGHLLLMWGCLAIGFAVSYRACTEPCTSAVARLALPAVCLLIVARVLVLSLGADAYHTLGRFHSDRQYTYVHFQTDGTWQRTFDATGSAAKLWRCERFLATYPQSAYYPGALLHLAECRYELWDFRSAAAALDELANRCPTFRGYPDLLRACTLSAAGDAHSALRMARRNPRVAEWCRGEGALFAAAAARRLHLPNQALGFYNSHIEFLRSRQPTSWSSAALAFAADNADDILDRLPTGTASAGTVRLQVLGAGRPLANVRVILVQPHADAAFPTDSRQFTGAWTVPAWTGIWGDTDYMGRVTLTNVPYGRHSIVLGLSLAAARRGYVVASWVPPVHVERPITRVQPITLVRAIELTSPSPGATVTQRPRLSWTAVPGAATYAVSLVVQDEPNARRPARTGQTCWAKSGITTNSVEVEADHFTNGHSRLEKGASYMWIVYAIGKEGRLITSSEHYAQLHEPSFLVR